ETGLGALLSASARHELTAVHVAGGGAAERELAVPYRGERLSGSALLRQLDAWVATGVIESSCADAVRAVAASPEWLALPGRTVVVLGAGAEVGPLPVLLNWGARVIGIDLPRPAIWDRVLETARRSGGTLLVPVTGGEARPLVAAVGVRPSAAPPRLSGRVRSRHLRQPGRPAGAELRAGQAPAALARHGRP